MRPDRFQRILVDVAASIPGVNGVKTLAETGDTTYPYGVGLDLSSSRPSRWQIAAMAAPGDRYAQPEPEPMLGEPIPKPEVGKVGSDPASVVKALVAAVVNADPGEIRAYDLYAERPDLPAIGQGATIEFYDGSRIFLNPAR
jgi:hypothetical protein